jgi:hypothetical protein
MKHMQRMVVANAVLSIAIIIVVLQLWLLTATMEQYLGGDTAIIVPAALASIGCFGLIFGLLFFHRRKLDH